tara:strand:- start:287 stop:1126 length:840 start_codon:yes stop_codon:yes gene_type:complete
MSYSSEILLREFIRDRLRKSVRVVLSEKLASAYSTDTAAAGTAHGTRSPLRGSEEVFGPWGARAEGLAGYFGVTAGVQELWRGLFGEEGRAGLLWAGDSEGSKHGASVGNLLSSFFLGAIRNPAMKIGDLFPSLSRTISPRGAVDESYSIRRLLEEEIQEEDFVNLIEALGDDLEFIAQSLDKMMADPDTMSMMESFSDLIGASFSPADVSGTIGRAAQIAGGEDKLSEFFGEFVVKPFISSLFESVSSQISSLGLTDSQQSLILDIFSEASSAVSQSV